MPRRVRLIVSILCLILSVVFTCVLIESFHEPRVLIHTTEWTRTLFTIQDGCLEWGHPDPARLYSHAGPPYPADSRGWYFGYVADGVGDMQLPSFFPGYGQGTIFISSFSPVYYGTILAGYWILLALMVPALPLLWRQRRAVLLIVLPAFIWCGAMVLWHRSFSCNDQISFEMEQSSANIASESSGCFLAIGGPQGNSTSSALWMTEAAPMNLAPFFSSQRFWGDRMIFRGAFAFSLHPFAIYIKYWLLAIPVSIITLPILAFESRRRWWSWRSARRSRIGLCGKCGYDLRASTDCCPECGELIRR
jgi:hypothetical protein